MKKLFLPVLLAVMASEYTCQAQIAARLDSLINARLATVAPGCAVLVAKKGSIFYEKGFGKASLELNVAMQPEMIFRLGSITKQYTAIAILQLMEQGKLSLQDSIQRFIKDFPDKGHKITVENLLTHTSGIISYESFDLHIPNGYRVDLPPKQLVDSLAHHPLVFTPGSRFSYCNSNYFLLGYIIEQISGQRYADYIREHIFKAAGLTHTWYDEEKQVIPGRVSGYARYGNHYESADYISLSQVYAAGALLSNVEDLYKWHEALYSGKLVKKGTLEKAFTPFRLNDGSLSGYGYGWFIKDLAGSPTIEHSGGIDGFQSDEVYFPKEGVFVATLYNSLNEGGDDMSFMNLSNDIATLAIDKPLAKEVSVPESLLQQYVGVYAQDTTHNAIITLEKGQLQVEAPAGGLPKTPLVAESQTRFLLKLFKVEFEFVRDKNGAVSQMILHLGGKDQVCTKIK